jgi:hypothetical protein
VWLPGLMLVVGLGFGAGHWHLASMPVTFALIFPLVLLAAFAGTLSANLGLMLVLGYAIGDLFFAGPPAAWAARYRWPVDHFFHLTIPQLVSYLLFFMLAALPILNTRIMLGDLIRRGKFKRPDALPAKAFTVLSVLLLAAIHGAFVYTWTFTAPMIFRLSWVWAGQGASPFNITYFQNITVPWLPAAAMIAFLLRCWLEYRVGSNEASANAFKKVLAASRHVDARPRNGRPRMLETLFAALVVTLLSSGFFWSIPAGVVFLLVVTALFYLRAFILPKRSVWQGWAQKAAALPIVIRAVGAIIASYFVTRWVLSVDLSRFRQYGFIFKNFSASVNDKGPADFWVELVCIALGLVITLALLPDGSLRPQTQDAPLQPASKSRSAYGLPMMMFIGSINFCLDPFCCFGASDLLVALMIAALLWEMLPFLLALSEIVIPLLETGFGVLGGDVEILGAESLAELQEEEAIIDESIEANEAWEIPPEAKGKIPEEWGEGVPNRKNSGTRWQDPNNQGNGVRIDPADPDSPFPSQQVDHVVVRNNGNIIGPDGNPITGPLKENPQAHIPLSTWLKWLTWDKP